MPCAGLIHSCSFSSLDKRELYAFMTVFWSGQQNNYFLFSYWNVIRQLIHAEQFSSLKHYLCTKTFVIHRKIVDPLYIFQGKMQFLIFKNIFY
jgi:hypothetical protein